MSEINPTCEGRYVIFYDLPSEHRTIFSSNETALKAVQNTRWKAGELLHELGLECTQSTILVVPTKNLSILPTKERVMRIYGEAQAIVWNAGIPSGELVPDIEILELVSAQIPSMARLVEHTLTGKIDQAIERVNGLIDNIDDMERRQTRRLCYRLPTEIQEWATIQDMATAYGINTSNISALIELLREARLRV